MAGNEIDEAVDDYARAYQRAKDPLTRSPGNVEVKNTFKKSLIGLIRQQVRRV